MRDANINALYLGNWLADMSQVNDPRSVLFQQLSRDLEQCQDRKAVSHKVSAIVVATMMAADAERRGAAPTAQSRQKGTDTLPLDAQIAVTVARTVRERV